MAKSRIEEPEELESIEHAILRTVAATLGLPPDWKPGNEEFSVVRDRLLAPDLDERERLAIAEFDRAEFDDAASNRAKLDPDEDRLGCLLTVRARTALLDATQTVAHARGLPVPDLLPEAQVVRGRGAASSTLATLRAVEETETVSRPHTLIVADEEAHRTLTASPAGAPAAQFGAGGATVILAARSLRVLETQARTALAQAEASGRITPEDPLLGRLLGEKYLIKKRIGKGGFGTVYLAEDKGLGAPVAIKVLNERAAQSPEALRGFFEEAKLLTTLDHPNIVRWITFDQSPDGLHYFVMEYVKGKQLDDLLEDEKQLAPKRVAEVLLQVVDALRAAHNHRDGALLHLDLKPNNVLVLERFGDQEPERLKVIDFGISQSVGAASGPSARPEPARESAAAPSGAEGLERSMSGSVTAETLANDKQKNVKRARGGTPLYASPEQCEHLSGKQEIQELDGRSDLYSLGVMAFKMLTGRYPFDLIRTRQEALDNHISVAPRKIAKVGVKVPRRLANFVDRCLQKKRELRWPDADAAYRELDEIVHPRTKVLPIAAALVVVFGGVLTWVKLNQEEPGPSVELLTAKDVQADASPTQFYVHQESRDRRIQLQNWKQKVQLPPESPTPHPVLVDSKSEQELGDWEAGWASPDATEVRIQWKEGRTPDGAHEALLLLKSGQTAIAKTGLFTLRPIEPWSIGEASVPGLPANMLLDPRGQKLRVPVRGSKASLDALKEVRLLHDGELLESANRPRREGDEAFFEFALDTLGPTPGGGVELNLEVEDLAGEKRDRSARLALSGLRIQIEEAGFYKADVPVRLTGESHSIAPEMTFKVRCSRAGSLLLEIKRDNSEAGKGNLEDLRETRKFGAGEQFEIPLQNLGSSDFVGRFVATVSDDDFVYPSGGKDIRTLPVRFDPRRPELAARVGAVGLQLRAKPDWNHVALPGNGRLPLQVARATTSRELAIEARLMRDGEAPEGVIPVTENLGRASTTADLELPVRGSGTYRVLLSAFDLNAGERGGLVTEVEYALYLESEAPTIELALDPEPVVVDGKRLVTSKDTQLRIQIRSSSPLVEEPTWRLLAPDNRVTPGTIEVGTESLLKPQAAPRTESVPIGTVGGLFGTTGLATVDGNYTLTVTARNAVGTKEEEEQWQIAFFPPDEPTLSDPDAVDGVWTLGEWWQVTVGANDPNEIRAVTASAERDKDGTLVDLGLLTPDASGKKFTVTAPLKITPDWSERMVRFHLHVEDRSGQENSRITPEHKMPEIVVKAPLALVNPEDPRDEMVLIRGNKGFNYSACGNLANLKSEETNKLRPVDIEKDGIHDFYLDAREVTRGQFLAFLESGFDSPDVWKAGLRPDAARLDELRASASTGSLRLPMTDVTLIEASAFALSRGKRLPSLLEWEFTVRGGSLYRRSPRGDEVLEKMPGEGALAEVEALDDICLVATPEGMAPLELWHLASNVREWTWTAGTLDAQALLAPLTPPSSGEDYYWTVGGCFEEKGSAYYYGAHTKRLAKNRYSDTGFRCALNATERAPLVQAGRYAERP